MKRRLYLIILLAAIAFSGMAQTVGEAFYIYRNDGGFNAFFRDEVQSIEYSNYDADGNYYDEIVTQIVNTVDSVYKIPLAAIDSVAFDVNRITVSPDYVPLSEEDYMVEKADTASGIYQLRFMGSVPLLKEGDIVSVVNDTLAQLVRIATIDRMDDMCIRIQSHRVELGEVFTGGSFTLSTEMNGSEARSASPDGRVFYPVEISFYDDNNKLHRVRRDNTNFTHRLYNKTIDFSGKELYKTEHTCLYAEKCKFDFALDLVISCNFSSKDEAVGLYRKGKLELIKSVVRGTVNTDFMLRFDASASKSEQTDALMLKANIHKPVVATFVVAGVPIVVVMNTHLYGEHSYDVSGNFSAYTGHTTSTTAEIGLSWSQAAGVRPYGSIDGSFEFHKPTIEGDAHLEGKLSVFPRITFSLYGLIGPTFDIKPYVHPVLDLGFYDQMGTNKDDYYGAEYYLYGGYDAAVGISELSVLGKEPIIMSPSWNVIDKMLLEVPKKIEFVSSVPDALKLGQTMKVTFHAMDYDYIINDYINEILPFPVKFETNSGTLSSDFALVEPGTGLVSIEWTPDAWKVDGKDAYILALMYTPDGHVKAADRWTPSITEDNPTAFTACPDSNHPHMIDLGLPSGTKWACCNLEASKPEEYGGHYVWGETSTKRVYNTSTYMYYQNGTMVNIGSDIAGTKYDAATAIWGNTWRMPTIGQFAELVNNCSTTWTSRDGVVGREFIGPSGGTIFLPAVGWYWDSSIHFTDNAGSCGKYWSSTAIESGPYEAWLLYFNSGGANCANDGYRRDGLSIRPVSISTGDAHNCSVILSDFKVTKSRYKEGGFENDAVKYDYRFDVSVTATLDVDDISYVREWGYVYEDPNGKKVEIPLSKHGTQYTDTRYAYFRNTAHSTARLYGYAYIVGNESPIYGEVHDFPLDHNMAVATTGDCSNVTTNSATVSCTYENVPEGAVCGVEYTWNEGSQKQMANSADGTQSITLSGLKSGTTYTYRAYIDDDGQMYYGEDKTFTTKYEIPDISGTWNCKEYQDGAQTGEVTLQLNANGTVTRSGISGSASGGNDPGRWSINADGKVYIYFEYVTYSGASEKSYSGTINSFVNPSQIEGISTYRYTGNMGGGSVKQYDFVMTR